MGPRGHRFESLEQPGADSITLPGRETFVQIRQLEQVDGRPQRTRQPIEPIPASAPGWSTFSRLSLPGEDQR